MSYRRKHIHPKIRGLKRKKNFFKNPFFWISLLVIILISISLYFILFFPKIRVLKIDISGNEKVYSQDIENLVRQDLNRKLLGNVIFSISSNSIFIVDTKKIINDILNNFPAIEKVDVQKKFPNAITLVINERKPFAYFCQSTNKCFLIDKNGIIFQEQQNAPKNMIVLTKETNIKELLIGENIIEKNTMNIISAVRDDLKNNFQIDIKEAFISNPLIFKTSENWQIYFDPKQDTDLQVTKMNTLLLNQIPTNERKNLRYIYLQYKDRAYYKTHP